MDVGEFLGLEATHNPNRWFLPVAPGLATLGRFLFGGAGLGAAILALERTTERPVVWATAQYLSYAMIDEIMDLDVTIPAAGRHTAQARVVGHVGDREILTVNAALGERELEQTGQWATMPEVPGPDDCEIRESTGGLGTSIMSRIESRLAVGQQWDQLGGQPPPEGRASMWVRLRDVEPSAASLAVLGDYVPWGISQAFGSWTRSNSLDNTMRVVQVVPTDWVLLDVRIQAVHHGFGHGDVYQWSQDGTLMGIASQSAIVREVADPTPGKLPPWMLNQPAKPQPTADRPQSG
ncbi:MAG: thioesterase family protein [Microthrixaceae bacterium]|nr:thioesterase family protein [Microthrixaceae bacterium]